MGVGAGLYMCDVVVKSSRSLSHLLMSSCWYEDSDFPSDGSPDLPMERETFPGGGLLDFENFLLAVTVNYGFKFKSAFSHGRPSKQLMNSCQRIRYAVIRFCNSVTYFSFSSGNGRRAFIFGDGWSSHKVPSVFNCWTPAWLNECIESTVVKAWNRVQFP